MIGIWLLSGIDAQPQRGGLLSSIFSTVGQVAEIAQPIISSISRPNFGHDRYNIGNPERPTNRPNWYPNKEVNQVDTETGVVYTHFYIKPINCQNSCNLPCGVLDNDCVCQQDLTCLANRYQQSHQNNHQNNYHQNNYHHNNYHQNNYHQSNYQTNQYHQPAQLNQVSVSKPKPSIQNQNLQRVTQCFYHEHQGYPGRHSHNCGKEPHGYHYHDYSGNTYVYSNGRYHRL